VLLCKCNQSMSRRWLFDRQGTRRQRARADQLTSYYFGTTAHQPQDGRRMVKVVGVAKGL
jgi:hypothetical protein